MNQYTESIRPAWQNPMHVIFDKRAFNRVVIELAGEVFELPDWRAPVFPEADDDTFIEFLGVANAVNFCFTDFKTGKKFDVEYPEGSDNVLPGAFAMWASFKRAMEDGIDILDKDYLAELTLKQARHIFRHVTTPIPMLEERVRNLRNIGQGLKASGMSGFAQIFMDADFHFWRPGDGIVARLVNIFDSYNDIVFSPDGSPLYLFHKRAQLFPMMYHGRAMSSSGALQPLRDPEHIGPVADYELPKALRDMGVLVYSEELAAMVDGGSVIDKDSQMEIEIRAQTVHAMWELLEGINALRSEDHQITMAELDYAVWRAGKRSKSMHHYTYTAAY